MIKFKRFLVFSLLFSMSLGLVGCGKKASNYEPIPEEDNTVYNISILKDDDSDSSKAIIQGFTDAANDVFGEKHINISTIDINDDSVEDPYAAAESSSSLVLTVGEDSLRSALSSGSEKPVVATGIVDFKTALHIPTVGDASWDNLTGSNITGVNSLPEIASQLSVMIEETKDLQTVGILYESDDYDGIYQNEILEKYLDQAGIAWKEYCYSAPVEDIELDTSKNIITPGDAISTSIRNATDDELVSIGESDLISGINSSASNRTAKVSKFWTGPKVIKNEDGTETKIPETTLSVNSSLESVVSAAVKESSVVYISSGSHLKDNIEMISDKIKEAKIPSFGGDMELGEYTLCSLFWDPYNVGYSSGKKAYKILVNGENPGEIQITNAPINYTEKLYNQEMADLLEITFPKSFKEISAFKAEYVYGSNTTRTNANSESE